MRPAVGPTLTTLFFDIDGTLCTYGVRPREALRQAAEEHGVEVPLDPHQYYELYKGVAQEWPEAPYADVSNEAYRRLLAKEGYDDRVLARQIGAGFRARRLDSVSLFPGTEAVLADLGDRFVLGIISNGPSEIQRAKLAKFGLARHFQTVVISGEVGVDKPEVGIFEIALENLGASAAESAHVGDSLLHDVQGAQAAGLLSVWVDRGVLSQEGVRVTPHHTLGDLSELPPLLTELVTPR